MATTIVGSVKLKGLPDIECFETLSAWATQLANNMLVELPADELTGVVVSVAQPDANAVDKLWVRRSSSGSIIGAYVFSAGAWVQLFPAPNQIFWLHGNSSTPPKGYQFVEQGSGIFTTDQYAKLIANAILGPNNVDFVYYPAIFVGI